MTVPPPSSDLPIAIVGGGLVGATLALALARAGLPVCVIDAETPERVTASTFDGRVSAIAASSVRLFEAIGLWPDLEDQAQPINDILVSDGRVGEAPSPLTLHFDPGELATGPARVRPLGHLLENRVLRRAQILALGHHPMVDYRAPRRVLGATPGAGRTKVDLDDGTSLNASLVIAADGRESPLRAAAGIKTIGWSYAQVAIVATIEHERDHQGVAHELFLPSGPFAILPMRGSRSSIVWTERKDKAQAYMALDDVAFTAEVAKRFGDHWGALRLAGPRWTYPLALHLARSYVAPRLALVGDSAHGIHPIAGQGLNLGLRDVAALAEVLVEGRGLGLDPGDLGLLQRYETWRRTDNVTLAVTTDLLNRLFSTDLAPLRTLRDLGLGAVQRMPPLRRLFMRHAMGEVGKLPKLLQGLPLRAA